MLDWLRLVLMIFYSPTRGLREVRDRGSMSASAAIALLVNSGFLFYLAGFYLRSFVNIVRPAGVVFVLFQAAGSVLFIGVVFVPLAIALSNLFERRGTLRLIIQQEYSSTAATVFYAWTAANLAAFLASVAAQLSGVQSAFAKQMLEAMILQRSQSPSQALMIPDERLLTTEVMSFVASFLVLLLLFGVFATLTIHVVFRLSALRSLMVVVLTGVIMFPASYVLVPLFSTLLASPFLLFIVFMLLRGYVGEINRTHRARVAFKHNLEAATLNPADASAHYNLALIHQQRGELDAARERFERAVQIDADEIDAHYQLGRIARQQKRNGDAISHFEQVVLRDPAHSQYEIWREVGATYNAAGQYDDARTALDRFLEHRESDPEGLYLAGRAHAGLGHRREAASLMEACINAVKTAPAYKYRLEKRWLNEAQQFLKNSGGQEA